MAPTKYQEIVGGSSALPDGHRRLEHSHAKQLQAAFILK
jgi:hypothetical protein